MKKKIMIKLKPATLFLSLFFMGSLLISCGEEKQEDVDYEITRVKTEVSPDFKDDLEDVFDAYVELKNAFFDKDAKNIRDKAGKMKKEIDDVDARKLQFMGGEWEKNLLDMKKALVSIEQSENLADRRSQLEVLSISMYETIKTFGLEKQEVYRQYCPMAFDNEGAYWLSDKEKIQNPYFGDEMPECGEVREKLVFQE